MLQPRPLSLDNSSTKKSQDKSIPVSRNASKQYTGVPTYVLVTLDPNSQQRRGLPAITPYNTCSSRSTGTGFLCALYAGNISRRKVVSRATSKAMATYRGLTYTSRGQGTRQNTDWEHPQPRCAHGRHTRTRGKTRRPSWGERTKQPAIQGLGIARAAWQDSMAPTLFTHSPNVEQCCLARTKPTNNHKKNTLMNNTIFVCVFYSGA